MIRCLCLLALATLTACGTGDDTSFAERVAARTVNAPDEFRVLPQNPLQLPEDLSALPPPIPGAPNRGDIDPEAEVLEALSGRPVRAAPAQSDGALLAAVGAAGVSPTIRADLAEEDTEFRDQNRGLLLERLAGVNTELEIYDDQLLDAEAEYERLIRLGILVPPLPAPAE
ncbi:MAG: DUF3035 domain-containing protein [Pseudomonadota bacterium]